MESIKENDPSLSPSSTAPPPSGAFRKRTGSTKSTASHRRRPNSNISESTTSQQSNTENSSNTTPSSASSHRKSNNVTSSGNAKRAGQAVPTIQKPIAGSDKWLLANYEPNAMITTLSSTIELANLAGDGDYRLLIASLGISKRNKQTNLRIYHGTSLQSEMALLDVPCALKVVFGDREKCTSVVIASGAFLFVYKNLRPFFKYVLPHLEINQVELDAWCRFQEGRIGIGTLEELLLNLGQEVGRRALTARSKIFLNFDSQERKLQFAELHKTEELKRFNVITCMVSIKKTLSDSEAPSVLVCGTESREVFILESDAFTIISSAVLPEVPVFVNATGLYDVDYRLLWACRDGNIYLLKRGYTEGKLFIQLNSHPVGLVHLGSSIVVGTMDSCLHIFTSKGQRTWTMKQEATIIAMEALFLERHGFSLVAVSLSNKKILFYYDKRIVDTLILVDPCVAMKFGRFGREDNTFICVTSTGSLIVQILKRTSNFDIGTGEELMKKFGNITSTTDLTKLIIPKKTKLFVDQTMREREQFLGMHKSFQQELLRLKLNAARTYAESLKSNLNPLSLNHADSLKLAANVLGLGPVFLLRLELTNSSSENFLSNLLLVAECDDSMYRMNWRVRKISCILPNAIIKIDNHVESLSQLNLSGNLKIYICNTNEETPMLTAIINMPKSEIEANPETDQNPNQ